MSTELIWRDVWTMGIEPMDADHREMLRLLNRLFATSQDQADTGPTDGDPSGCEPDADDHQDSLIRRLDDVLDHLRRHFAREEAFLQSIDYPLFEEHRGEHALEMAELVELRRDLLSQQGRQLDQESIAGIKRWFFNHVIAEDHRYAEYYFAHAGSSRATEIPDDP